MVGSIFHLFEHGFHHELNGVCRFQHYAVGIRLFFVRMTIHALLLRAFYLLLGVTVLSISLRATDDNSGRAFTPAPSLEKILAAYQEDKNEKRTKVLLAAFARGNPSDARPVFQLAMLCEKTRDWAAARDWFVEFLRRDPSSPLAQKVHRELSYVRWAILYEKTLDGWQRREALNIRDQARHALVIADWKEADALANKAIGLSYSSWDIIAIKGTALFKLENYRVAEICLQAAAECCPDRERPAIAATLAKCQREQSFAEANQDANIKATSGKYAAAAAAYLKAWKIAPERYSAAVAAIQCFVMAEDYAAAKEILVQVEAAEPDKAKLPSGLRDPVALYAQLDKLAALGGKSKVASSESGSKSTKSRPKTSSSGQKKTMAQDFLSRINKK